MASLLSTFNVASFSRTVEDDEKEAMEEEKEVDEAEKGMPEVEDISWKELLGARAEEEKTLTLMKMGKGKRERRRANIVNIGGGDSDNDDDDADPADSDFSDGGKPRRQRRKIESEPGVVGLTEREKSAFTSRLFKFGLRGATGRRCTLVQQQPEQAHGGRAGRLLGVPLSSILTSHIEHLKRKARVTKAHQSGLALAHGDHGHDDSPYAKELQRVGIIELSAARWPRQGPARGRAADRRRAADALAPREARHGQRLGTQVRPPPARGRAQARLRQLEGAPR